MGMHTLVLPPHSVWLSGMNDASFASATSATAKPFRLKFAHGRGNGRIIAGLDLGFAVKRTGKAGSGHLATIQLE